MANVTSVFPFLNEGLEEEPARALYPPEDMFAPAPGDELRFIGDEEGPSAAWVWSHHNRIALCYFESFLQGFHEWAYVMWDSQRLDRWGVLRGDVESLAKVRPKISTDRL